MLRTQKQWAYIMACAARAACAMCAAWLLVACGGKEEAAASGPVLVAAPVQPGAPIAQPTPTTTSTPPVAPPPTPATPTPASATVADNVTTGSDANFGTITLAPGFGPSAFTVEGISGGNIDASKFGAACSGWTTSKPDHLFVAQADFGKLNVLINGGTIDTTLTIQKPDGTFLCNDDGEGAGLNPVVAGTFAAGTYRIWVGSLSRGENVRYRLGISESPVTVDAIGAPTPEAGKPDLSGSNFGTVTLAPRFSPDPHVERGTSGGNVRADSFDASCKGSVSAMPDHVLEITSSFPALRVLAFSQKDITLVLRRPDGTFLCNDDGEGTDPVLSGPMPAGTYHIWIGSFEDGISASYKLGFSELSTTSAASL